MASLIRKLHMHIGLLNFPNLMVFGIAGLAVRFHPGLERRPPAEIAARFKIQRERVIGGVLFAINPGICATLLAMIRTA